MHAPELNWEHSKREKRNRNLIWTSFSVKLSIRWKGSKWEMNFRKILTVSLLNILTPNPLAAVSLCAKSLQLCPTLWDPIDGSPQSSPIPRILQARTLERVAISFSNAWKWKVKVKTLSCIRLLATPWTAAYQASPSMGFSRQEYWSGVPLPSPTELNSSAQI